MNKRKRCCVDVVDVVVECMRACVMVRDNDDGSRRDASYPCPLIQSILLFWTWTKNNRRLKCLVSDLCP